MEAYNPYLFIRNLVRQGFTIRQAMQSSRPRRKNLVHMDTLEASQRQSLRDARNSQAFLSIDEEELIPDLWNDGSLITES